ncbi:MAG: ATP synthase F1 subunit delta [Firmicutes bacterium]|nr:ATP synthase F1 subunit delta [Bacillota bacterium]
MKESVVANRYAQALFDVSLPEEREKLCSTLTEVAKILNQPQFKNYLMHPRVTLDKKREFIQVMKLSTILEKFLLLVLDKGRINIVHEIATCFEHLVAQEKNSTKAKVVSAVELTNEALVRIKSKLENLTGKSVEVNNIVSSDVIGGLVIEVEGKVIDSSLARSIEQLKKSALALQVKQY